MVVSWITFHKLDFCIPSVHFGRVDSHSGVEMCVVGKGRRRREHAYWWITFQHL